MQTKSGRMLALVAVAAFCASAGAQMVVHAVSGMVKAIDTNAKTMDVVVDDGAVSEFKLPSDAKVTLDFNNSLRAECVDANKFEHVGDYVVVYYYGFEYDRTAVAIKDLGTGPFEKVEGTVMKYDKHDHTMTVQDDGGKSEVFALNDHMVVDSGLSVDSGRSYGPHRGDHVRVTYKKDGDTNTPVFIRVAVA